MADEKHKMAMDAIGFAAQILRPQADQFAALIRAEQSMHSYLHITDPTLYKRAIYSDSLRQQVDLAKAALAFILAVQKVKDEIAEASNAL
ncbi:hypothetical protein OEW28_18790 [Defluviimonas sp. WL0002]|uniref:Uncharacterized protein n=1 Tax=Albidovulum marisflavi TaxID=2984159 RepID=A0ABT2ZHR4_9RHOB|nr:hypothetical protein [Defluviimonas sp. WL0002]MCV2870665.1 hypothetical protein [Defluviimonas sp. WL0002]